MVANEEVGQDVDDHVGEGGGERGGQSDPGEATLADGGRALASGRRTDDGSGKCDAGHLVLPSDVLPAAICRFHYLVVRERRKSTGRSTEFEHSSNLPRASRDQRIPLRRCRWVRAMRLGAGRT